MQLTENQRSFLFELLGDELKKLREEAGLDIQTAARYAGISLESFEKYEQGGSMSNLSLHHLMRWAAVFGKRLDICLRDYSDSEKVDAYESAKKKLADLQRAFFIGC